MQPIGPQGFDLSETRYSALNCKNGIIASLLRDFHGLDITPVFSGLYVGFRDIIRPMTNGDIAGAHLGAFEQGVWTRLFAIDWHVQSVAASAGDFVAELSRTLAEVGPVLAPHDGYYDENAADKFQRVHALHNSMIYGISEDGTGLNIADRHLRVAMPIEAFHRGLTSQGASLLGIRGCRPFEGDWRLEFERMCLTIRERRTVPGDLLFVEDCLSAIRLDGPGAQPGRWLQAHSYLKAVGASRAYTVDFARAWASRCLAAAPRAIEDFVAALGRWAETWILASALAYKFMATGREEVLVRVRENLVRVLAEEAEAMPKLLDDLTSSLATG